tara:strand:+ start:944 stop:1390 length:447 start_codon:yes stop_codon:yes gene_type:complete
MRLLLMGVPDGDIELNVNSVSAFCEKNGITEVMYSSIGPVQITARMDTIGMAVADKNGAKTISTQTQSMGIINWVGRSNNDITIPLWPLRADYVIVMTNPQYRRQIRNNPKKLAWADWYREQDIPIYIYDPDYGADGGGVLVPVDEFK